MCGGDPLPRTHFTYCISVFSTCVEVIPITANVPEVETSILHVCGGDPKLAC